MEIGAGCSAGPVELPAFYESLAFGRRLHTFGMDLGR